MRNLINKLMQVLWRHFIIKKGTLTQKKGVNLFFTITKARKQSNLPVKMNKTQQNLSFL